MIPMSFADALDIYGRASGVMKLGTVTDWAAAMRGLDLHEFTLETLTALVIIGDKLMDAERALNDLREVNTHMTTALEGVLAALEELPEPESEPVGLESMVWTGPSSALGMPTFTHDLAQEFAAEMRRMSKARHPSKRALDEPHVIDVDGFDEG